MILLLEIKLKISTNPKWAKRALLALWQAQTPAEQNGHHTDELNGVGFNKIDAEILSSFADQVNQGRDLSPRQLEVAYKRLPKYANQLLRISLLNQEKEI